MRVQVDLLEAKKFVESEEFIQFLLNNTTDVGIPAFILQTLLSTIEKEAKEMMNEAIKGD